MASRLISEGTVRMDAFSVATPVDRM